MGTNWISKDRAARCLCNKVDHSIPLGEHEAHLYKCNRTSNAPLFCVSSLGCLGAYCPERTLEHKSTFISWVNNIPRKRYYATLFLKVFFLIPFYPPSTGSRTCRVCSVWQGPPGDPLLWWVPGVPWSGTLPLLRLWAWKMDGAHLVCLGGGEAVAEVDLSVEMR